jgi:hypothetical protein
MPLDKIESTEIIKLRIQVIFFSFMIGFTGDLSGKAL